MATPSSLPSSSLLRQGRGCAERLNHCLEDTFIGGRDGKALISLLITNPDSKKEPEKRRFETYAGLSNWLGAIKNPRSRSVIVTLSSPGSFDPLAITKEDLQQLVIDHDVDVNFAAVVAAFGELPRHSEHGYSCASRVKLKDGSYSISYLYRFSEKDTDGNWKIRQSGVYQNYSKSTDSHFWILLNPHPEETNAFSQRLRAILSEEETRAALNNDPFRLHELLIDTYLHNWRWYLLSLGERFATESGNALTARIDSQQGFDITLKTLQRCKDLLEDTMPLPSIFNGISDIMARLQECEEELWSRDGVESIMIHRPFVSDVERSSEVLVKQIQGIVELIGNTLDLKNQSDAAKVNEYLLGLTIRTAADSATIRVITLVTLFYLPATFLATVFGMNFFDFDESSKRLRVSHDLWIYVVIFVSLTAITFGGWRRWMRMSEGSMENKSHA